MNKISIAIIDDESLVRLGIKSSVEWENYGYEIIGEADNGQNGLENDSAETAGYRAFGYLYAGYGWNRGSETASANGN